MSQAAGRPQSPTVFDEPMKLPRAALRGAAPALTIADLTLTANRYQEKRRPAGGLWVELISTVDEAQNSRLLELLRESFRSRTYYPARRDDEPLGALRLGLPLWSRCNGRTSYHLVLLDRPWDEWTEPPGPALPARAPADGWLRSTLARLGGLLKPVQARSASPPGHSPRSTEIERSWQAQFAIHEIDDVNRAWPG
jgi:hypothetical protein